MPENGMVSPAGGLNLRRSPRTGRVVRVLPRGQLVEVLGRETWVRVRAGNQVGFVLADYLEPVAPAEVAQTVDIQPYANTRFIGERLDADLDFHPHLDRLNELADSLGVEIWITSGFRRAGRAVSNAIVTPARMSNHLVGHAIDMNLRSSAGFFNSKKLRRAKLDQCPQEIRDFITGIADLGLRWGGNFSKEDPVHIDDNLNHGDPGLWKDKFQAL